MKEYTKKIVWDGVGVDNRTMGHMLDNIRYCAAFLFSDMDNPNFVQMPEFVVTYGRMGSAKGQLVVHKDFGCVNHNAISEYLNTEGK